MLKKWMTSLVLILVLATGVLASVPVNFGGHGCSDMDCCMTKMGSTTSHDAHGGALAEQASELYCFLNCSDPTLPGQAGAVSQISPSFSASNYPAAVRAPAGIPVPSPQRFSTDIQPQNSQPVYIRHLALLI